MHNNTNTYTYTDTDSYANQSSRLFDVDAVKYSGDRVAFLDSFTNLLAAGKYVRMHGMACLDLFKIRD